MEEVRNEVRSLRGDIASLAKDVAELKRLVSGAYGGNGHNTSGQLTTGCSRSPFQTHYRMADGTCACQHNRPAPPRPWAGAQG